MTPLIYDNIQHIKAGFVSCIDNINYSLNYSYFEKTPFPGNKNIVDTIALQSLIQNQINTYDRYNYTSHKTTINAIKAMIRNDNSVSYDENDIWLYKANLPTEIRKGFKIKKKDYIKSFNSYYY